MERRFVLLPVISSSRGCGQPHPRRRVPACSTARLSRCDRDRAVRYRIDGASRAPVEVGKGCSGMNRDSVALGLLVAVGVLGVAALVAASLAPSLVRNRLRGGDSVDASGVARPPRWPAAAAIVLVVLVPLVQWAASAAVGEVFYSDESFEWEGVPLQLLPPVLVCAAAVVCAHLARRQTKGQTRGRTLAVTAAAFAYGLAGLVLLALVAMLVLLPT